MVGLPTSESRELILKKLLAKEKVEGIDFKELATITEGYSGSDLKVTFLKIWRCRNDIFSGYSLNLLFSSFAESLCDSCLSPYQRATSERKTEGEGKRPRQTNNSAKAVDLPFFLQILPINSCKHNHWLSLVGCL
jgi:hypothetical protein